MKITKDYLKRLIKEEFDQLNPDNSKKVWVVIEDIAYEGGKVVAVFDSEEAADERAAYLDKKSTMAAHIVEEFILNK